MTVYRAGIDGGAMGRGKLKFALATLTALLCGAAGAAATAQSAHIVTPVDKIGRAHV